MTGASLTGVMVTAVVCVVHRSGEAPSQTRTETSQLAGGVGPAGVKAYAPVLALMLPPHVSAGPTDHVAPGPSGSDAMASYVYATSSVALVAAALVITGASFTGVMVTVVVCVAHRPGDPPSQTRTEISQLAGGVGPAGVKAYAPVPALMLPPHVSAGPTDHVAPGPSGSDMVALYVYATSSVAVVAAALVMTGASFTGVMVTIVVCVAHRSGEAPSQTVTSTTQLGGGVGPTGMNE